MIVDSIILGDFSSRFSINDILLFGSLKCCHIKGDSFCTIAETNHTLSSHVYGFFVKDHHIAIHFH
ncbi:MAG: hypothetical protein WCG25_03455 [bacterium]